MLVVLKALLHGQKFSLYICKILINIPFLDVTNSSLSCIAKAKVTIIMQKIHPLF